MGSSVWSEPSKCSHSSPHLCDLIHFVAVSLCAPFFQVIPHLSGMIQGLVYYISPPSFVQLFQWFFILLSLEDGRVKKVLRIEKAQ